jgi:hypothetical protein
MRVYYLQKERSAIMSKKGGFIPLQVKCPNRAGNKSLTGFTMIELLTVIYGDINAHTKRSKKPGQKCYVSAKAPAMEYNV